MITQCVTRKRFTHTPIKMYKLIRIKSCVIQKLKKFDSRFNCYMQIYAHYRNTNPYLLLLLFNFLLHTFYLVFGQDPKSKISSRLSRFVKLRKLTQITLTFLFRELILKKPCQNGEYVCCLIKQSGERLYYGFQMLNINVLWAPLLIGLHALMNQFMQVMDFPILSLILKDCP